MAIWRTSTSEPGVFLVFSGAGVFIQSYLCISHLPDEKLRVDGIRACPQGYEEVVWKSLRQLNHTVSGTQQRVNE